jgi:CheY-like chemotaxis protein
VIDTGCGISREQHARIFEFFVRAVDGAADKQPGHGLGLAIVSRFARLLGFDVGLESDVGVGSTFRVRIPAARVRVDAGIATEPAVSPAATDALRGLRVLVIDDDALMREAIARLVRGWGATPFVAATAAEAVDVARSQAPGLILADHHLADGESGIEIVHQLRARAFDLPALLVTGDVSAAAHEAARTAGIPMIDKAAMSERLQDAVVEALAAKARNSVHT